MKKGTSHFLDVTCLEYHSLYMYVLSIIYHSEEKSAGYLVILINSCGDWLCDNSCKNAQQSLTFDQLMQLKFNVICVKFLSNIQ